MSTIPRAYRWAGLDEPYMHQRVVRWDQLRKKLLETNISQQSIVLVGPPGTGKTSTIAAMVRSLADEGTGDISFVMSQHLAEARAQHGLGSEVPIIARAMRCDVLALDDLGNERKTELSAISDVIVERHANERVTWVTCPFGSPEIAKRYGDGIARRIFEKAMVVNLSGQ